MKVSRRLARLGRDSWNRGYTDYAAHQSKGGLYRWGLPFLFVLLAAIAFGPASRAPFDFDDIGSIVENALIRHLGSFPGALRTPPGGTAVSGRPLANLSFTANYAVERWHSVAAAAAPSDSTGYHVVNIALHVIVALLLFGVIRRTVRLQQFGDWSAAADRIAGVASAIWLVHPIQTEAIDYVSQRTEVLASLFVVATLYAAIRAFADSDSGRTAWSIAAIVSSAAGMASKEVAIVAPLLVILYDRAFVFEDWRAPLQDRPRRALYLGLVAMMAISIRLVAAGARGGTAGIDAGVPWYTYLYTQGWAIWHYLRLLAWPTGLAFDYGRTPIHDPRGAFGLVGLACLAVATIAAWRRPAWRWLGFLGAWFFVLLAPSSSIVPIRTEIAAERRVYLASIAVIVLVVVAIEYAVERWNGGMVERRRNDATGTQAARRPHAGSWTLAVGFAIAAVLTLVSAGRSALYANLVDRWSNAVVVTPTNGRAYDNLASALLRENPPRVATADSVLHRAMLVDSTFAPAWVRASTIALAERRLGDARSLLERALVVHPGDAAATGEMGKVLLAQQKPDSALPYLTRFADVEPTADALTNVGVAYLMLHRLPAAVPVLQRAAALDPTRVDARRDLASALIEQDRGAEALPYIEQAARFDSTSGVTLALLSLAYAQANQADAAARAAASAMVNAANNPVVFVFAGRALSTIGRFGDASNAFVRAINLDRSNPEALTRLAMAQAALGKPAVARHLLGEVLDVLPNYPLAVRALESSQR